MGVKQVYLGLGGNIGDTRTILASTCDQIAAISGVTHVRCSPFYLTSPVSDLPQKDYINAVVSLQTTLSPIELFYAVQKIEKQYGKEQKKKNAPRILDIDILFFGHQRYYNKQEELEIPHPRWHQRLFVLVPLADLTATMEIEDEQGKEMIKFNIAEMIRDFPYAHEQQITLTEK